METQDPQAGPLTHEEVAAEVGRAFTDPTHPMYPYRWTEKGEKWADALYRRIPRSEVK
jgi:hypothetical protein